MVPALAVNVARTVSPLAQVVVLRNVVPSPRLRAEDAVAASDLAKSRLVTVRDDTGSNSTMAFVRLQASWQSFHKPSGRSSTQSSEPFSPFGSLDAQLL